MLKPVLIALGLGVVAVASQLPKQVSPPTPQVGTTRLMCSTTDELLTIYKAVAENDKHTINTLAMRVNTPWNLHDGCHFVKTNNVRIVSDNGLIARISVFDDTMFGYMTHDEATKED
jgi:hypothetical protein